MKLHTFSAAPNAQRIDLLLREKSIELDVVEVNIRAGEQLRPEYRAMNPNCDVPMLELADGTCISQIPAIALYLEEVFPEVPLFGTSSEQRATTVMWDHLCTDNGLWAVGEVLRNSSERMVDRALVGPHNYAQTPALVERGRRRTRNFFADMDQRLRFNDYVAGEFFSMADITLWVVCGFAGWIKEPIDDRWSALLDWKARVDERPAFQTE